MSRDGTKDKALFDATEAKLDSAQFDNNLSFAGEDPQSGDFISTMDRLIFEKLSDVLTKVLTAKGFSLNIENYLAAIEQVQVGIQAKIEESNHPPYHVQHYSYNLKVPAPSKRASGPILEKFYKEIKAYELQILKLKEEQEKAASQRKTQTVQELREEIKALKQDNQSKTEEIKILNERLERALSQVGFSDQQIKNIPNLDDGAFRQVKVTEHKLNQNKIYLKSKNTSFSYPIAKLSSMPLVGSKCLAYVQDGTVTKLFPYDGKEDSFQTFTGKVIDLSPSNLKVRDSNRNLINLPLHKIDPQKVKLKIGSEVLIQKYQGRIINWKVILKPKLQKEQKVIEENYQRQLTEKAS